MNKSMKIRRMVGIAILSSVVIVLQIIANYVQLGPISITLSLVPVVVGAILYGPVAGLMLGVIDGIIIFFAPTTIALFYDISVIWTLIICLGKTGVAGLLSGLVFKLLKNRSLFWAVALASVTVPLVNTGLFAIGTMLFFQPLLTSLAPEGQDIIAYLFLGFIGYNFIIEFAVNSLLAPTILHVVKIGTKNYNIGSTFNQK